MSILKCSFFFCSSTKVCFGDFFGRGFRAGKIGNELENLKTTANKKILEGTHSIDPP